MPALDVSALDAAGGAQPPRLATQLRAAAGDRFLAGLLLIIFVVGLYGIHWGRVEAWNTDQMAMRAPFQQGADSFSPGWFQKPPFHTYTNFFVVRLPLIVLQKILGFSDPTQLAIELIVSRLLTLGMYLGALLLFYCLLRASFERFAARVLTALFGTGAGLFVDTHYLTADIPVLFWMLFAFYFAHRILQRQRLRDYLLAGLLVGLATATKYNGLAVGLAIPLAHLLASGCDSAAACWRAIGDSRIYAGVLAVPVGFVLGNPYAVLHHEKFLADFVFNYQAAAVYDGRVEGHSYLAYFERFQELIGLPGLVVVGIAVAATLSLLLLRRSPRDLLATHTVLLAGGVFLVYYLEFGALPRLPARFVMPSLPLFMILAAPAVALAPQRLLAVLLAPVIAYNLVCAVYVGQRFCDDARMLAQRWVQQHVSGGRSIESHIFVPEWSRLPGVDLQDVRMPYVSGRWRLFDKVLAADSFARVNLDAYEHDAELIGWYSRAALLARRPDFVAIDRLYYGIFFNAVFGPLYPELHRFFDDLLHERMPYRVVFHVDQPIPPAWVYPQEIEQLSDSMTILQRDDERWPSTGSENTHKEAAK